LKIVNILLITAVVEGKAFSSAGQELLT